MLDLFTFVIFTVELQLVVGLVELRFLKADWSLLAELSFSFVTLLVPLGFTEEFLFFLFPLLLLSYYLLYFFSFPA